jgi:hypothetical protein
MECSTKKRPLNFRNVHGVVVMNRYVAEKTIGPIRNRCKSKSRDQFLQAAGLSKKGEG